MKRWEKIIAIICVVFLVGATIYFFLKIFKFEDEKEKSPYTDEFIDQVYSNINYEKYYSRYTIYSGFYTTYQNLAKEYVASCLYYYLMNNNRLTLNNYDINELNGLINANIEETIPISKITIDEFNNALKELFGSDATINVESFNITPSLKGYCNKELGNCYIYEVNNNDTSDEYFVYREKEGYATSDKETLIIYDYYIKCNYTTGDCFNDDRMAMPNNIKLENGTLKEEDKGKLAKYKHVYKLQDDKFYWYSSEIIEN